MVIRIQTQNADKIGETSVVAGKQVVRVGRNEQAEIHFEKYTSDYKTYRNRKWLIGRNGYATMESAVRAFIKKCDAADEQFLAALGPCSK
jgi:hypothetical protein